MYGTSKIITIIPSMSTNPIKVPIIYKYTAEFVYPCNSVILRVVVGNVYKVTTVEVLHVETVDEEGMMVLIIGFSG